MENQYQLRAVLNTESRPVKYRIGGKEHFQVFLSIKSEQFDPSLEKVAFVEYELHKTFKNRIRISKDRTNGFEIELRTYGTFVVKVTVNLVDGGSDTFSIDYKEVLERK